MTAREILKMHRSALEPKPSKNIKCHFFSTMCRNRTLEKVTNFIASKAVQDQTYVTIEVFQLQAASHLVFIIETNLSNPLNFHLSRPKYSGSLLSSSTVAIEMKVDSFSLSRTTFQIVCFVSGSTCAVGSSKTTILLRCGSTRAKQINCALQH